MEEVPFEDRHVPRMEIEWGRSAWWWLPLTRAIHPAIKLTSLVLSLFALWLTQLALLAGHWIFAPRRVDGTQFDVPTELFPAGEYRGAPFNSPIIEWFFSSLNGILSLQFGLSELAFATFVAIWLTGVFSILGGVIARRAMVELGQQTIAPWGESIRIVCSRWQSFLWVTGMHLVALFVLLLPFAILGWMARFGAVGASIAGLLLLLGFPLAFAVGRLTLSLVLCFPLSVCAIAAEKKADAFEGFSRSNAYLFQRPVVAVLCAVLLGMIGLIGEQLVAWTLFLGWGLMRSVFFASGGSLQPAAEYWVKTGNWISGELILAYWFSFFWAGSAAIYLILRRSVDSTEMDELDSLENPVEVSLPEIPRTPPTSSGSEASTVAADAQPTQSEGSEDA